MLIYLNLIADEKQKREFEEIYYEYRYQMFFLARKQLGNDKDAEDVVHDVFLKIAIRHMPMIESLESDEDVRNYLLKATQNTAINFGKKRSRIQKAAQQMADISSELTRNFSDEEFVTEICNELAYEELLKVMAKMNDAYKEVLYYHFVLGMSAKETAEYLGRKTVTVKKQIARGKKMLAELAKKEGLEYADEP